MRQIIAAIALLPIVFGGCNTSISSDTAADQSDFTVPSAPTDANTRSDRDILATDGPVDRIADAAISLPLDSEIVDAMSDVLLGDTGSVDASVTRDVSMEDAQPAPESVCPETYGRGLSIRLRREA